MALCEGMVAHAGTGIVAGLVEVGLASRKAVDCTESLVRRRKHGLRVVGLFSTCRCRIARASHTPKRPRC